jgi:hypothetical protein
MESQAHWEALLEMDSENDTWENKLHDPGATPMVIFGKITENLHCLFPPIYSILWSWLY